MSKSNPLDGPELSFYSFWKPDPLPSPDQSELLFYPLGSIDEVTRQLLRIPNMSHRFCPIVPSVRLLWRVGNGVVLQARPEQGQEMVGDVITLSAVSAVSDQVFYRLYVQLREQFGVTLLDETHGVFLSVEDMKRKIRES